MPLSKKLTPIVAALAEAKGSRVLMSDEWDCDRIHALVKLRPDFRVTAHQEDGTISLDLPMDQMEDPKIYYQPFARTLKFLPRRPFDAAWVAVPVSQEGRKAAGEFVRDFTGPDGMIFALSSGTYQKAPRFPDGSTVDLLHHITTGIVQHWVWRVKL